MVAQPDLQLRRPAQAQGQPAEQPDQPRHFGVGAETGGDFGDGQLGQVVRIVGNDLFAVNTTPTAKSFGILIKDYKNGEMPGIYCMGGVYETDVFEGTVNPGDDLKVSANGPAFSVSRPGSLIFAAHKMHP